MTNSLPLHILVIDDDADTRLNLVDILEMDGYGVQTAATKAEALARSNWDEINVIILDRRLPDGSAEELLPKFKRLAPKADVIIATGYPDLEGAITAIRQGAADYLLKPINMELLRPRLANIAERKRAESEITRLNQDIQRRMTEMQTLLDVIPIVIAIAEDPQCQRVRVNNSFARLLKMSHKDSAFLDQVVQWNTLKLFHEGEEMPETDRPLRRAAAGAEIRDCEFDLVLPDGTIINLFGHAAPLFDEEGKSRGAVGAFIDVTERKRAQEKLMQTERLAAIGQMMAGLAHESGNALARSQVCLEMLRLQVEDRPKAQDLVDRVQLAQDHLQQLYEEVRGYAAPLTLERTRVSVQNIWRQAWGTLELIRKTRNVSFVEECGALDLRCPVDAFRLQQVFRNILENALAACKDPAKIAISCSETHLRDRPAIRIAVRDNGPGLSAEQRQRIFEPFFTTKTKGTGLGMAIVKRIVETHGGRIDIGANQHPGAEIVITLLREGA
jgi:PAS domain S-box-containing protein